MCGIAGIHVKRPFIGQFPVDALSTHLLHGIEHRGKHATGIVAVGVDGKITLQKRAVSATEFNRERNYIPNDARTILLHTRYATKGDPSDFENNHPVVHGTCFATHNGQIRNDDDVIKELGLGRPAAVDSIAIPMALYAKGLQETEHIKEALEMLRGPLAMAAIDPINCPGKLVLAKGDSNPLWVLNHPKVLIWASTRAAIEEAWGLTIGTPTKKMVAYNGDPTEIVRGGAFYNFRWGDLWIIDDDQLSAERWKQPVGGTGYQAGGFHNSQGTPIGQGPHSTSYSRPSEKRNFSHTKTWLCTGVHPDTKLRCAVADAHGCYNCTSLACKCYKSEYLYSDPQPWGEDDTDGDNSSLVTEALIRCDGCYEWLDHNLVDDQHYGTMTLTMCEDCRLDEEWNLKSGTEEGLRTSKITRELNERAMRVVDDPTEKEKVLKDRKEEQHQIIAESVDDTAEKRHKRVCAFVADRHGLEPEFVDYIMFQASDDELSDQVGDLLKLRCTLDEDYASIMKEEK